MSKPRRPAPFPSKREILDFIRESPGRVGKREIARAFRIRGGGLLGNILREMKEEGLIERGRGGRHAGGSVLPEVAVIEVTGTDSDGEVLGRPASWHGKGPAPRIYLAPERRGRPALGPGDRVLARLSQVEEDVFEARTIRVLAAAPRSVLGIFSRIGQEGRIASTERHHKHGFAVLGQDCAGARSGELVLAEILPGHQLGLPLARVRKRLGDAAAPGAISLVAIHGHDLPAAFPPEAVAEARAAGPAGPEGREDLRSLPLVTIDEAEAHDFDDAVFAEADPGNEGGWHIIVAIADVAHYVRPGDALDESAAARGNSTYFPDRVLPMLPEELSAGLCSLQPGAERPCLAVHVWIAGQGRKLRHRFVRGLMRSVARLTYEQVQNAHEGRCDGDTAPLADDVIAPLYGAFAALLMARKRRGALDFDLPERKVHLDPEGHIAGVEVRERLDSHRLIEEFMIAANIAAAETLERRRRPCMYRVHEPPETSKLEELKGFLSSLGYHLPRGRVVRPRHFTQILRRAAESDHAHLLGKVILRAQSKALYSAENLGHYGLALSRYAHFTSPIRRYADLLVHRVLIDAMRLGDDGLGTAGGARFSEIAEHVSFTERRSEAAERDAIERYTVSFLKERVGAAFAGRINGVTRFGLFVTLDDTGAEGLVPARALGAERFLHDERHHCLTGLRSRKTFTLGDRITVRLAEASPATGGLLFTLAGVPSHPARWQTGRGSGRRPVLKRSSGRKG